MTNSVDLAKLDHFPIKTGGSMLALVYDQLILQTFTEIGRISENLSLTTFKHRENLLEVRDHHFQFSTGKKDFLYFSSGAWVGSELLPDPLDESPRSISPIHYQFQRNPYRSSVYNRFVEATYPYLFRRDAHRSDARERSFVTWDMHIGRTSETDERLILNVVLRDFGDKTEFKSKQKRPSASVFKNGQNLGIYSWAF